MQQRIHFLSFVALCKHLRKHTSKLPLFGRRCTHAHILLAAKKLFMLWYPMQLHHGGEGREMMGLEDKKLFSRNLFIFMIWIISPLLCSLACVILLVVRHQSFLIKKTVVALVTPAGPSGWMHSSHVLLHLFQISHHHLRSRLIVMMMSQKKVSFWNFRYTNPYDYFGPPWTILDLSGPVLDRLDPFIPFWSIIFLYQFVSLTFQKGTFF